MQDFKYALRSLRKTPGLTTIAVITIAIGIGFNAANFSVVEHLLLSPIQLPDLDRLVMLQEKAAKDIQFDRGTAPRTWMDYRDETHSYSSLAACMDWNANLTGIAAAEQVMAAQVSPDFFTVLGERPALGRTFAPDEVRGKNDHVAILADRLWRTHFGSDPGAVGKTIQLDGETYTVVGVMPRTFRLPSHSELWTPMTLPDSRLNNRTGRYFTVVGRLKPGVTVADADAEIRAIGQRHAELYPDSDGGRVHRAVGLARGVEEDSTRTFILVLTAAAGFVLLIVCANIANLLLARGASRRRELAVRAAMGAGRWQLVRLLLAESLLLSVIAGGLSLLVAAWSIDFIKGGIPPSITRFISGWDGMAIDGGLLAFTLGAVVLTALGFGLVPALSASHADVSEALKETGRSISGSRRMHRLRGALAVVQVGLALAVLTSAGALVKGFLRAANPRRGLDPTGVLTFYVALPDTTYGKLPQILAFQQRAVSELRSIPGVEDAAAADNIPWGSHGGVWSFTIDGQPAPRPQEMPSADIRPVDPNLLSMLRVPIQEGRGFEPGDNRLDAERVALLSRSAVRKYFPDGNAVGAHVTTGEGRRRASWRVVGITGDVYNHWDREPPATLYVPEAQALFGNFYLTLRVSHDPHSFAQIARSTMAHVDPAVPLAEMRTLEQVLSERVSGTRLGAVMMAAFAAVALLLSVIGIYGVIAYLVAQRQHEIGIRLALGAQPRQVLRMMMTRGVWLAALGMAVGLPAALVMRNVLLGAMPGVVDAEPTLYVVLTAVVVGMAVLGTFIPARRAAQVDPMTALRVE